MTCTPGKQDRMYLLSKAVHWAGKTAPHEKYLLHKTDNLSSVSETHSKNKLAHKNVP